MGLLQLNRSLLLLIAISLSTATVVSSPSLEDTFKQCLVSYQPQNDLRRCFGVSTISRLQSLDANPEFDLVDGLTLSRDSTQEFRESSYNYGDRDPSEFR